MWLRTITPFSNFSIKHLSTNFMVLNHSMNQATNWKSSHSNVQHFFLAYKNCNAFVSKHGSIPYM